MGKVIDITGLLETLNAVENQKDTDLIRFLSCIKSYKEILLSKRTKLEKLFISSSLMEGINHVFSNILLFSPAESLSDLERKLCVTLEALRMCTDQFCELMILDMSEEALEEKSKSYETEIVRLAKEYEKLEREIAHNKAVSEFGGNSK